ncbi:MAG TPA: hypothetical protein VE567_02110 [Sphingomonas sp.]|nr:hypothetical protein [Sphingomonas sp.]
MAEAIDGPALHEVEIALSGVVPEIGAVAADEDRLRARSDVHQRVKRMDSIGHVDLLWAVLGVKRAGRNARRPHFMGAAFSKSWLN